MANNPGTISEEPLVELFDISTCFSKEELDKITAEFVGKFNEETKEFARSVLLSLVPKSFKDNIVSIGASLGASSSQYRGYDQSYDPALILKEFLSKASSSEGEGNYEIFNDSNNLVTIPKKADPQQDLAIISKFFSVWGNSARRILRKAPEQWVPYLTNRFQLYNISTEKKPTGQLNPKDITVERVASTIPHFNITLVHRGQGQIYVNFKALSSALGRTYPRGTLTKMFSGMIPKIGEASNLIQHAYFYEYVFDGIIHRKKKITDFGQYLSSLVNYVDAIHKSRLYEDEFRLNILKSLGLVNNTYTTDHCLTDLGRAVCNLGREMWQIITRCQDRDTADLRIEELIVQKNLHHKSLESSNSPPGEAGSSSA